jgi:S1-C subfamily serine protease
VTAPCVCVASLALIVSGCTSTPVPGWPIASVVRVTAPDGIGSGVLIRVGSDVVVLTAAHVVEGATNRHVIAESFASRPDNPNVMRAEVVRVDYAADLAVIRLPSVPPNAASVELLPRGDPAPCAAEYVLSATCAAGLGPTPTSGMVSAVGVPFEGVQSLIVTAPMVPGSSGGGVFVCRGGRWYYAGMARAVVMASGYPVFDLVYVTPVEFIRDWLGEG